MKIIVDLEATCCEHDEFPRSEMEIIEIGACAVEGGGEVISEFQSFVRPIRNPILTDFCKTLTSITQDQVDAAPIFPKVLEAFTDWLGQYTTALFCSWGEYDAKQLRQDCRFHEVEFPFGDQHVNVKAEFSKVLGTRKRFGVGQALRRSGLEFKGTPHRGIDDARSIARLATVIESKKV